MTTKEYRYATFLRYEFATRLITDLKDLENFFHFYFEKHRHRFAFSQLKEKYPKVKFMSKVQFGLWQTHYTLFYLQKNTYELPYLESEACHGYYR
jgi:hypothetical protein